MTPNGARGLMHFNRAVQLSEEGVSKRDAAERLGLTVSGLDSLLYKRLGSKRWPVKEASNGQS